ncbi:Sarcosine oxidase subunit beta [Geodia barretti]|uniref:FAD-dependent oxidoreductase domain-containing protein 1 n=1 Tax=Geodia barretti TaxID=519541 RepID=A0AA35W8Y7_GEOBA|nr:Sarcosine oxidase subunit beta [Geodia barretti]
MWQTRPLKDRYRVVIIGGGVHGLSTAYYLTKLGVTDIAVLDKGYLGGGASARTTAIIRFQLPHARGPREPQQEHAAFSSSATGKLYHDLIKPFALSRFHEGKLVNERAAAPAAAIH